MDLWSKKDLKYSIEHVQAKFAMLGGAATREEEERQVEDGDLFENPENSVKIMMVINAKIVIFMMILCGPLQICTSNDCS